MVYGVWLAYGSSEPSPCYNYSCPLVLFYRSTWAVFPYTLLFLCWHSLALRAGKIFSLIKEKKNQPVTADAPKGFMLGASTAMGWVLLWGFQDKMQNTDWRLPCGTPIMFWEYTKGTVNDVVVSCIYVNMSTSAIMDWKRERENNTVHTVHIWPANYFYI